MGVIDDPTNARDKWGTIAHHFATKRSQFGVAVGTADPSAVQLSRTGADCGTTVNAGAHRGAGNRTGLIIMNMKKILTWAGIALLLFFLITQPNQSAGVVTGILNTLRQAAEALITFVKTLFV
jgi:hypothetical protein